MARAAARPRPADAVLPAVNTLIRLTIGASGPNPDADSDADSDADLLAANVPSRIEDVELAAPQVKGGRTQLFVAVPHYAGDVDVPCRGTPCRVTWVSPDGLYDLPTGFVERVSVGPVVWAWRVEVTGPAVRAQRREYVRVPWTKPVVVEVIPVVRLHPTTPADAEEPDEPGDAENPGGEPAERDIVQGNTLDLSEGGIRCALPSPPLGTGQPVRVHLDVERNSLVLDGTVVRVATAAKVGGHPHCETGIAFTEPDEYGDLLRKVVFSELLRLRRSGIA